MIFIEDKITYIFDTLSKILYNSVQIRRDGKKAGDDSFRVNRHFLINRNSVKEINNHTNCKLKILFDFPFQTEILVKKKKHQIS